MSDGFISTFKIKVFYYYFIYNSYGKMWQKRKPMSELLS